MQNREEVRKLLVFTSFNKDRAMWQLVSELGNLNEKDLYLTTYLLTGNKCESHQSAMSALREWGQRKQHFLGKERELLTEEEQIEERIFVDSITRARRSVMNIINTGE